MVNQEQRWVSVCVKEDLFRLCLRGDEWLSAWTVLLEALSRCSCLQMSVVTSMCKQTLVYDNDKLFKIDFLVSYDITNSDCACSVYHIYLIWSMLLSLVTWCNNSSAEWDLVLQNPDIMVILDPFQAFNTILLIKNYIKHQVVVSKDPLESSWYSRWKIKNIQQSKWFTVAMWIKSIEPHIVNIKATVLPHSRTFSNIVLRATSAYIVRILILHCWCFVYMSLALT